MLSLEKTVSCEVLGGEMRMWFLMVGGENQVWHLETTQMALSKVKKKKNTPKPALHVCAEQMLIKVREMKQRHVTWLCNGCPMTHYSADLFSNATLC